MNVTLITGASVGIGEAFARQLAIEKHNLLLVARSENKLSALCDELTAKYNISAQYIAVDLIKADADQIIFEETERRGLAVEWLINNAGIGSGGDLLEHDLKSEIDMMHLNMDVMVALTYRFLPNMRARKSGRIINVGSMAGFGPIPYMSVYAASKNFVHAFTAALEEENRLFNIKTMLLCPGATETNFFEAAKIGSNRKANFSTKKLETPEQVVVTAMKGIRKNKRMIISGTQNKIGKIVMYFIPDFVIIRLFGKQTRAKLNL